ncbi:MAG: T9SS type A sorting domain-containing protein [Bacteroidota bacterium]
MKRTIYCVLFLILKTNLVAQTYVQSFENINLTNLVNDSSWVSNGLSDYTGGLLGGNKALQTSTLSNPASATTLTTPYFKGVTNNSIQFDHRIQPSNSSNVRLYIYALDSVDAVIKMDSFIYSSSNSLTFTHNFIYPGSFKLHIRWSGSGGSTVAYLDNITMSSIYIQNFVPLPASIIDFKSFSKNSDGIVSWTSLSEENLERYDILRSTDGINFNHIGSIYPKHNQQSVNSYLYTDESICKNSSGEVYYRLRIVDKNGDYSLSNTIKLLKEQGVITQTNFTPFPNPATTTISIETHGQLSTDEPVKIMDSKGFIQYCQWNILPGNNYASLDISSLATGIYFINTTTVDGVFRAIPFVKE